MAIDIKFSYICRKKFEDLKGDSDFRRHCDDCNLEVINLDPLDEQSRLDVFEKAACSPTRICIAATIPVTNGLTCPPRPPVMMRTAGVPIIPSNLEEERKRLEKRDQKKGLLARLKFR